MRHQVRRYKFELQFLSGKLQLAFSQQLRLFNSGVRASLSSVNALAGERKIGEIGKHSWYGATQGGGKIINVN